MFHQFNTISRRKFIASQALLVAAAALRPVTASATVTSVQLDLSDLEYLSNPRSVNLVSLHTHESLQIPFWKAGHYLPQNLASIDALLRDHRTQQIHKIDPRLLDYLCALTRELELTVPVQVISGYRSPATNATLRKTSTGVARRSFHMSGRAIDIRIPGVPSDQVRDAAVSLKLGGVGYYRGPDFVHLDTGPVRAW